ncbi:hypothetical protein E3P96_01625 [Wallemia ichthyophaga]|nr:hypothetical protein E3P96_01625 [Wallemia ichthyophaga]
MSGQFVRALGNIYHLDCFKCHDCGVIVANKFFPIQSKDGISSHPLCETHYFRRLDLICANCDMALRVFGPKDSYYEHQSHVYCHFHYSTRFAIKCSGCKTAILKQFVEINRNSINEHWHPECYMINKFWNVKIARPNSITLSPLDEEALESPLALIDKQKRMEEHVFRIWTVLSAFEESSAACISEMLRHVSTGAYITAVRMAGKFIIHVEVLFAAMDKIEDSFLKEDIKSPSHYREARMLCRKTVSFLSILSHTHEAGSRRMGITKELLSLVTGLAHYLKILIRIALTASLKLDRDYTDIEALPAFLDKLSLLLQDPISSAQHDNPNDDRYLKQVPYGYKSMSISSKKSSIVGRGISSENPTDLCFACNMTVEDDCIKFGTSLRWTLDCFRCDGCHRRPILPIRSVRDRQKDRERQRDKRKEQAAESGLAYESSTDYDSDIAKLERAGTSDGGRRLAIEEYYLSRPEPATLSIPPGASNRAVLAAEKAATKVVCTSCKHTVTYAERGFTFATKLEQYSYLLNVGLTRLFMVLKTRGVVPSKPRSGGLDSKTNESEKALEMADEQKKRDREAQNASKEVYDSWRDSSELKRIRPQELELDRKLSATARLPRRSTVVESPIGSSAVPSDLFPSPLNDNPPVQEAEVQPSHPVLTIKPETGVRIVHENAPNVISELKPQFSKRDDNEIVYTSQTDKSYDSDAVSLVDMPQIMEANQAREQRKSLSRASKNILMTELSSLEALVVKHAALYLLERSEMSKHIENLDDLLDLVEQKKANTFWGKFFKPKKEQKKTGILGCTLDQLVERSGVKTQMTNGSYRLTIPQLFDDLLMAMRQVDMSVEGVFRKNGNIRKLRELVEAIDKEVYTGNLTEESPVQLAALLKKFLAGLGDPIFPHKLYKLYTNLQLEIVDEATRKRILHLLITLLPKSHRDLLEVLFVFLRWVASFSHVDEETGSKMDIQNLAITIAPSVLYPPHSPYNREDTIICNRSIAEYLEDQDDFCCVPAEILPILHDHELFSFTSSEISRKDIRRRFVLCASTTTFTMVKRGMRFIPFTSTKSSSNNSMSSSSSSAPRIQSQPPPSTDEFTFTKKPQNIQPAPPKSHSIPPDHNILSTLHSHILFHGFLAGVGSDVTIKVAKWHRQYKLHKIILTQSTFFNSLFHGSFAETLSNDKAIELTFDDPNITRSAFEYCLGYLYGRASPLLLQERLKPSPRYPLTPSYPTFDISTDTDPALEDAQVATPEFCMALVATSIYLGCPSIANKAISFILASISPVNITKFLRFALGEGLGCARCWYDGEQHPAVGLEQLGQPIEKGLDTHIEAAESEQTHSGLATPLSASQETAIDGLSIHSTSDDDDASYEYSTPSFHYGAASDKIGEACVCWLSRWALDMIEIEDILVTDSGDIKHPSGSIPFATWSLAGIPARYIRAVVSSDALFVPGAEWQRYKLAARIVELRRRQNKGALSYADECEFDTMFADGIYYTHMTFEQLAAIQKEVSPTTARPYVPIRILQQALWAHCELRNSIEAFALSGAGADRDCDLGLTYSSWEIREKIRTKEGKAWSERRFFPVNKDSTDRLGDAASMYSSNDELNRYSPPSQNRNQNHAQREESENDEDASGLAASTHDPLAGASPGSQRRPHSEAELFGLQKTHRNGGEIARQIEADCLNSGEGEGGDSASLASSSPTARRAQEDKWSLVEPLRFAVEYWIKSELAAREKTFSHAVFYAGSYINTYIQINEQKHKHGNQLGIYVHRQSMHEPLPYASSPPSSHGNNTASPLLYSGGGSGGGYNGNVPVPLSPVPTMDTLLRVNSAGSDDSNGSNNPPAQPQPQPQPQTQTQYHTRNHSHSQPHSHPYSHPYSHTHSHSPPTDTAKVGPGKHSGSQNVPHAAYKDPRKTLRAFFTVQCSSGNGTAFTKFNSAPDSFTTSQSWGWKSSVQRSSEYLANHAIGPDEQLGGLNSLRAVVTVGLV